MTRQRCLIGVGVVCSLALALVLFRGTEQVRAGSADDSQFQSTSALKVVMKNTAFEYVTWPQVKRLGGRAFVVGYRVNASGTVWLPVDEVSSIEEYANLEAMVKVYPGLAPKAETNVPNVGTPVTVPKKN